MFKRTETKNERRTSYNERVTPTDEPEPGKASSVKNQPPEQDAEITAQPKGTAPTVDLNKRSQWLIDRETRIEKAFQAGEDGLVAIQEIQENPEEYKALGLKSFDAYLRERWGKSADRFYQLSAWLRVWVTELQPALEPTMVGAHVQPPERAGRGLVKMSPTDRKVAVRAIAKEAKAAGRIDSVVVKSGIEKAKKGAKKPEPVKSWSMSDRIQSDPEPPASAPDVFGNKPGGDDYEPHPYRQYPGPSETWWSSAGLYDRTTPLTKEQLPDMVSEMETQLEYVNMTALGVRTLLSKCLHEDTDALPQRKISQLERLLQTAGDIDKWMKDIKRVLGIRKPRPSKN